RSPFPVPLYRTGDRARYLPDGNIEYLGRLDQQLKLRGFRIEPGEIEAVLNQHGEVREAVVVAHEDPFGHKRLVAYLVPQSQSLTLETVRTDLQEKLPEYMIPSAFVLLEALPLTPNGKIDRRALPAPDSKALEGEPVAPRTPTEEILAAIWAEVLGTASVGVHDNFFAMGGHSLLATQLISRVRQTFSVELPLRDLFAAPTIEQLSLAIEALRVGPGVEIPPIEPVSRAAELPLSFAQQRLWFLAQLEAQSTAYSMPAAIHLSGNLQLLALEQAVAEIVQRHEVLRTTFRIVDGVPVQAIAPSQSFSLSVVDLRSFPEPMREVEQRATSEAQHPFELAQGPLLRVVLLQLGENSWVLLVNIHHIISDGWSIGLFVRELSALYEAFCQGKPSPLPPLPIQYADFAAWQRQWLTGAVLDQQLHYWTQQLAGAPLLLELPTDRPRPPRQSFQGSTWPLQLDRELTEALKSLSQQSGATLFMTLLAAFAILLARYSSQDDLAIGSPIANRNRRELEPLIGFFVNTLALRINLQNNPRFLELLNQVRSCALEAYAHQDLPFERLVEEIQPERDLDRTPLVQVVFALQNAPVGSWHLPGLTLKPLEFDSRSVRFDLECHLWEFPEGLKGYLIYNTDLFDASTISRLAQNFQTLLEGIVAHPDQQVFSLPLLTEAEQHQLLAWNDTEVEYPQKCIHELFEAQVERTPDAVAVVYTDQHLSYRELDQQANQLASSLQRLGVGPEVLVGICIERSLFMIVGLLGILKAGGAYVPLDPTDPPARLSSLLQDAQVSVLLTQQHLIPQLPQHQARIICLDSQEEGCGEEINTVPLYPPITPENLAYVIYTSGSTGNPKGVLVTHQGLSNLVCWHQRAFAVTSSDRTTQLARTAFDASAWEIWSALCSGAQLYLGEDDLFSSPLKLQRWLVSNKITITFLPTPLAEELLGLAWPENGALRVMLTGGDRLHQSPSPTLPFPVINNYGPTENTVVSTSGRVSPPQERRLPSIGRPIANVQVHILDKHLQPVPIGVPGELYLGGAGLARGYLNRPELTAEKFISPSLLATGNRTAIDNSETPNPLSLSPFPLTLYRTGDLARYLPDGNIEYLGRLDQQVKLRGFRIELGEIEKVLLEYAAVQEVAVTIDEELGHQQLVAYVVPHFSSSDQWQSEHLSHWQALYEQTYSQAHSSDPTFNIIGWTSSYTNAPLPEAEMRTWVNRTVERILAQQPQRVLEIGCGTGLLLSRIAPYCTQYWATDYSATAIQHVQQLKETRSQLKHVTLLQRVADDFEGIKEAAFDTVILNSVVQYFPSIDYLLRVLESSVRAAQSEGIIFVGDVRSLPLLEAYHASVAVEQAPELSGEELWQRVQQRVAQEEELAIAPAFFVALQQHFSRITRVHIQPKRGRDHNELTRFRYDVWLYLEATPDPVEPQWLDWQQDQLSLCTVGPLLSEGPLGIRNVPNARLSGMLKLVKLLKKGATKSELQAARELEDGIDPEDWWSMKVPGTVYISEFSDRGTGFYDVLFQNTLPKKPILPLKLEHPVKPWRTYANNPLQRRWSQLTPQLREFLRQKLPDYMIPSAFVLLETLPLTPNGKVDKHALPAPPTTISSGGIPRTSTEEALATIWREVLGREVGLYDSFFDVGGHSLLAIRLMARVEQHFAKKLPLATLFQNPTIEQLARRLCQSVSSFWSPLVPIQESGSQRPFFCIPGAGGNVLYLADLARSLGLDQPFYGLQALGLDGQTDPHTDIKEIAATYTQAIQSVQPQGPYLLGGHSFGAHVAFEMAQQLQRQGHPVAKLVIFDAPAPTAPRQPIGLDWDDATWLAQIAEVVERLAGKSLGLTAETLPLQPEEQLKTFAKQLQRINLLPPEAGTTQVRGLIQVYRANCQASYELPPEIIPTRIVLLATENAAGGASTPEEPTWGWSRFASDPVELHIVPGDHLTMFTPPHVQVLAQRLRSCLD
ncbi:MAG: amino acid adenylation domain-containing protein, partial [Cyanophyceae cyanobacterium]